MKNYKKFGIILLLAVTLPALFFSVYEIGSLNKNEEMIEEIYNNQLDVILFSVNQYSDDVATSWAFKLNNIFGNQFQDTEQGINSFIRSDPSIRGVFYTRDTSYQNIRLILHDYTLNAAQQQEQISSMLVKNREKASRLFLYFKNGYYKVEPMVSGRSDGLSYFMFVCNDINRKPFLCGLIVNTHNFVGQVLSPKIQAMIRDQFIISVHDGNRIIYTSEPTTSSHVAKRKPLWLIPNLFIGIVYKGKTIEQLVKERTLLNFSLILVIDILLFIGIWFVFKSFKTELQLAKMRTDFISNVSHEIRTPLALISLYIETILLGRIKPEKVNEYHRIIQSETNRLTDIVNKILNFSRMEEKRYRYVFTSINMNEMIHNALNRFDYHLKNNGFQVETKLYQELPDIEGDREALNEMMVNLIDNAIKYSQNEYHIAIETGVEREGIYMVITDKGLGIPESQQKYIFDKFYRGSDGEVHNIKGSGLGLAIVKHIVEGHKGSIVVHSAPGKGTSFKLWFPAVNSIS